MRKLITPKQARELLGISAQYLRDLADAGEISFTRTPGGHHRYYLAEILEIRKYGKKRDKSKFK